MLALTSRAKGIPSHVAVVPPEGGLKVQSVIESEAIRSISVDRLHKRWGQINAETLLRVEDWLRALLAL
ncbi:MAG: type II toxin-antitoxin system PemK/MazF family toxin [Candidatus Xenobia bacterium]